MYDIPVAAIEDIIGYVFQDKALLRRCFIHSSYGNEHKGIENNERLEFLGDSVLELVFTEKLYFEGEDEGFMTAKRQKLVSDETLEKTVKNLGLDKYVLFGGGKQNLGKKAIPSLMEAIIAGIYLDGGYEKAREFILKNITVSADSVNYVGKLQEYMQGEGKSLPEYECIERSGVDNSPVFTFKVTADGESAIAKGESKKSARMLAARNLYRKLLADKK